MPTIATHNLSTGQIEIIDLDDQSLLEHLTGDVGEAAHQRMAAEHAYLAARQQAEAHYRQALAVVRGYASGDPYTVTEVLRALCRVMLGE